MIRLLVVDDHPAVALGLAALLGRTDGFEVVGTATDAETADRLLAMLRPDVVLCDVMMDGRDAGFDLLARHGRTTRFVMFSAYDYPAHHVRAVREGAAAYLAKGAPLELVVGTLGRAAAGTVVFSSEVLASVRSAPRAPTDRERELLLLLAQGATNEEIAGSMRLRVKSVEGMLRRLFDRYGVENRTQLARHAEHQGWLTGGPRAERAAAAAGMRR
ncbi:MAG TPA: response regulator transcription factor [Candidatus Limnocylindrales bacterium]|nr:response regulator transcription factor [Candidatus Limnocylindrales bacterium]